MPDPDHPRYLAWRNQIEQELGKLDADGLLIGHSLGGSMLLKYLAEGTDPRPIAGMFLVAVPYWGKQDWELEYAVPDDFASHLPPIRQLFLYHSRSDEDVPFSSLRRYQEKLPQATVRARWEGTFFHRRVASARSRHQAVVTQSLAEAPQGVKLF